MRTWKGTAQALSTQIANDAVRLCYDHLAGLTSGVAKPNFRMNLFLFSYGGEVAVPWRLVSLFREFASGFRVIVPYTAMSAATMICLGADSIIMGRKGELGPIDPSMSGPPFLKIDGEHPLVGVEDVSSYVAFVKERCGVRQQQSVMRAAELLANQLGPVGLGKLNRQHAYIRLVGERLLRARRRPAPKVIQKILRSLIEDVSFHGHAISRREAAELGLHVETPAPRVEAKLWELYLEFERDFELLKPIDPEKWLAQSTDDVVDSDAVPLAAIESTAQANDFIYRFRFRRIREVPSNINIQIQIPGLAGPATDLLQHITRHAIEQATPAVAAALRAQCPIREVKKELLTAEWRTVWKGDGT